MRRLVVVGPGLMGASLGLAMRRRGWRVAGLGRKPASLAAAKKRGAISEAHTDPRAAYAGADAVVFCVPVDRIAPLARAHWRFIPKTALVMDVGSVKGPIVAALDRLKGAEFVGAHPMAGSEKIGAEHARADLYKGSVCALTPGRQTKPAALARAKRFWREAGAEVTTLSPRVHDRAAAMVSHLPHLIADSLAIAADRSPAKAAGKKLAAGSFRDATRVAAADPALWRAIFDMNAPAVKEAAGIFQNTLRDLLRRRWPMSALRRARRANARFRRG